MRFPRRLTALILAAAAHAAFAAPPVPSPAPLADHVPNDALLFFSWQGAQNLQPAYAQSNLKGFLGASSLRDFFSTTLPQIIGEKTNPQVVALVQAQAQAMLLPYWNHPTALYIGPLDFSKDAENPTPHIAVLCDAGKDAGRLNAALQNIVQLAGPKLPVKLSLAANDSLIALAIGLDANSLLAVNPNSLATLPAYLNSLSHQAPHLPPTTALSGYVDIHGIVADVQTGLAKDPTVPPDASKKLDIALDALGIHNVSQLAFSAGFDGKQWVHSGFLAVPKAPRTGLLRLIDPRPLPAAALHAIPKDAVTATASTLDLNGLFNDLRDALPKIDPTAPRQFDQALSQFHDRFGIDLDRDLLATLDGQIIVYRSAAGMPYVAAIKLKDPRKFAATLATLTDKANAAGLQFKVDQTTGDRGLVYSIKLPQVALAGTVHKDSLYISTTHGLDDALDFADASPAQPSLADNPAFAALRSAYPGTLTSLNYSDPAALYPEFYQAAQMLLLMGGAYAGVNLPSDLLPSPDKAAPFFAPTIQVSWSDADGIHSAGRSAFPGAEMLGTQQVTTGVAAASMGVAILLPSLARARELSQRSADAANERGIAQSCIVYATDHNDKLPDDLSQLVTAGQIPTRMLAAKRAGSEPLDQVDPDQAKNDPAFPKTLAAHTDFVYIGKGVGNDSDASIVILYERPRPSLRDGMNLAYDDAHVEFSRWSQLPEAFKATNDYRKAHHLPPVDVNAILKAVNAPNAAPAPAAP